MASHIAAYLKSVPVDQERYRSLKTLEADLCLLICSMFPEDSSIRPIEDLSKDEIGQNLFEDIHDMTGSRDKVQDLIDTVSHCYVSNLRREEDDWTNQYVKMLFGGSAHDLATEIASRYQLVFCCESVMDKWQKTYRNCDGLSLVLKKTSEHPVTLECPKLTLLQLQYGKDSQSLPLQFFEGMKKLRVLSLDVPTLPQSLDALRNLQTLRLKVLKLEDMSWIGCLINLEFLSISTLSLIDIHKRMRKLRNLRLLDLRRTNLGHIPRGALSGMLKLEKLYLPLSFVGWRCMETREGNNDFDSASLCEIKSLSLNALEISVPNASVLPKNSLVFKNVRRFKILVPDNVEYRPFHKGLTNELQLRGDACDIKESGICELLSRTENLSLTRVRKLKNVNYFMSRHEDYELPRLKKMIIAECDEVEYLVDTSTNLIPKSSFLGLRTLHLSMLSNMKEIWHETTPQFGWFENLREINIRFCRKLKYVFPVSIVKGLRHLNSIEILDCSEMEGILYRNEVEDNTYGTHFIEKLHLHSLPKMIGFVVQQDNKIGAQDCTDRPLTSNEIVSNSLKGPISAFDGSFQSCPTNESCITEQLVSNEQL